MRCRSSMPIRRLRGCASGSAAVEFALIALPVLLIALGTFDYFAANYAITTLEGAARSLAEYAWNANTCAGGLANPSCTPGIQSLFSAMQSNNDLLSGATQSTSTYYTCADNSGTSPTPPTCDVNGDTRVIEYIQVTVQEDWWQFFPWDPWSSTNPLVARMSTRIQ